MRPTLRQLQYLIAIADTGKFGEAAKLLSISQPSLSNQIAEMEESLNSKLVERSRKGAIMTPIGHEVVRRGRHILKNVEDLRASASSTPEKLTGTIRLGVLPTIGPYLLPRATRNLHQLFPDLRLHVREERTIDLEKHMREGVFDTIISTTGDHSRQRCAPLFDEELWICAAADDPLSHAKTPVTLNELAGRSLLCLGYGHHLNIVIQTLADAASATIASEYEGTSLDAIRQMAEMGAGVAVLPSLYALSEAQRDAEIVVRRIDHPLAKRSIELVWRDTSPLEDTFLIIADQLKQAAKELFQ